MTNINKYCELDKETMQKKVKQYVQDINIDFEVVKKYLLLCQDKVYKNIYESGIMNELVQ